MKYSSNSLVWIVTVLVCALTVTAGILLLPAPLKMLSEETSTVVATTAIDTTTTTTATTTKYYNDWEYDWEYDWDNWDDWVDY